MRLERSYTVHRHRAVHHQESGCPLLVGANASQTPFLHHMPETPGRNALHTLHEYVENIESFLPLFVIEMEIQVLTVIGNVCVICVWHSL